MNAETVLQWASDLGITLTLKNDRIQYRPKSRVPDEFVEGLRQYKGQVVERLDRQFRDELKRRYPRSRPSDEIAEIKRRLADSGICLTWCTALDDFVAFHRDDVPPDAVPAGFVPYSESELL